MNALERFEIWFACKKIDLGKWLRDSSKSYSTTYNAKTQRFETTAVGPIIMNGTPEWDAEQTMMKKRHERHKLRYAMDPEYKAKCEREEAESRASTEKFIASLDPSQREGYLKHLEERRKSFAE